MALHALGKLHGALAQKKGIPIVAPEAKAMVFYQAALLVYPKNYMAANDLGVLLAQCGNYAEARAMLEHSLSLCRQSTSWQNLAVVYRQLGQTALAARAGQQATSASPGRNRAAASLGGHSQRRGAVGRSAERLRRHPRTRPASPGAARGAGQRGRTAGRSRPGIVGGAARCRRAFGVRLDTRPCPRRRPGERLGDHRRIDNS